MNHLIPLVEATFVTPANNNFARLPTTGTISPGVIWVGQKVQFDLEALIPANRQSGRHVGVLGQVHYYLDDIFPTTLGRPIFQGHSEQRSCCCWRPLFARRAL